jgi:hypothetical protein
MRNVTFNKWIPPSRKDGKLVSGYWEEGFPNQGIFHQWASAFEEFESGPGNYTVALVELPDGTVQSLLPSQIKFGYG